MKHSNFFFPRPIEEDCAQLLKMREIENSGIRGFNRSPNLITKAGIDPRYGAVDAYEHLAPIIDTDRAMEWLMVMVQTKGAKFITDAIHGDLFSQEFELRQRFGADVIVNSTGLSSLSLAADKTCFPLRGALIRIINDGTGFPKVETSLAITADAAHDNEIVFIVPQNDNILLLGGIAQPHEWKLDLTLTSPEIQCMRTRCESFLPDLKNARVDPEYPLAQGLRPARERNVRVERELRRQRVVVDGCEREVPSRIVHSYGQGGAGWSLSFGCAEDVAVLVGDALHELPAEAMAATEGVGGGDVGMQARFNQSTGLSTGKGEALMQRLRRHNRSKVGLTNYHLIPISSSSIAPYPQILSQASLQYFHSYQSAVPAKKRSDPSQSDRPPPDSPAGRMENQV